EEPLEPEAVEMVLEVGAAGSRVTLLRGGEFLACRSIPIGGQRFTQELAVTRALTPQSAETLKCTGDVAERAGGLIAEPESDLFLREADFEPSERHDVAEPVRTPEDDDMAFVLADEEAADAEVDVAFEVGVAALGEEELANEFRPIADQLHMQVMSSINWFRAQLRQPRLHIERIVLAGAGSLLVGLPDYLARRFRLPVLVPGDEDFGVRAGGKGPVSMLPFIAAIGAALPPAQQAMSVDLRSEDDQRRRLLASYGRLPYVAAGMIVAASVLLCINAWLQSATDATALERYREHGRAYDKAEGRLQELRGMSTALQEDLRAIASRIFSGRDLLSTIRALKQQAPKELWITELRTEDLTTGDEAVDADSAGVAATIDRGSLYIEGRVKPLDEGVSERVGVFEAWYESIAAWRPDPDAPPLFNDKKVLGIDNQLDTGEAGTEAFVPGEFAFAIRFDFMPTQIEEVVQAAPREER
ncbi:MAG: hypothetical protein ACOCXA_02685, partial [Planctomycetota bacterium]